VRFADGSEWTYPLEMRGHFETQPDDKLTRKIAFLRKKQFGDENPLLRLMVPSDLVGKLSAPDDGAPCNSNGNARRQGKPTRLMAKIGEPRKAKDRSASQGPMPGCLRHPLQDHSFRPLFWDKASLPKGY